MPDVQHAEAPLADKLENVYSSANYFVSPGFGLDTSSPGGLYIGQNNANSIRFGTTIGSGQLVEPFGTAYTPQLIDVRSGTGTSPDTTDGVLVHVSRRLNLATGTEGGDGHYASAALAVDISDVATNVVQPVALYSTAITRSTAATVGLLAADATGNYGVGWATGASIHKGIGGFFLGRCDSTAAGANGNVSGVQIAAENLTANDATVISAGFSGGGVWITAGNAKSKVATAIEIGNSGGGAGAGAKGGLFDIGLHINGQVANGNTGPIDTASIQDDSNAITSLVINGTHTRAVDIVSTGGPIRTANSPGLDFNYAATAAGTGGAPTLPANTPTGAAGGAGKFVRVNLQGVAAYLLVWQ